MRSWNVFLGADICGVAALQAVDDAVADVHLVVEILALQEEQLQVKLRREVGKGGVQLADGVEVEQRSVERAYHVEPYPLGVLGLHLQPYALEHVARKLAPGGKSLHHLI